MQNGSKGRCNWKQVRARQIDIMTNFPRTVQQGALTLAVASEARAPKSDTKQLYARHDNTAKDSAGLSATLVEETQAGEKSSIRLKGIPQR